MKGEEIRTEYCRGSGYRNVYHFEDKDGEVLEIKMKGRRREECVKSKDEWLKDKRVNKQLRECTYAAWVSANNVAVNLSPGEGIMIKTRGFDFSFNANPEHKYRIQDFATWCMVLRYHKDVKVVHTTYGATQDDCQRKMQKWLDDMQPNAKIVKEIKVQYRLETFNYENKMW